MFDALADQIKQDQKEQTNRGQEILRWSLISGLLVLLILGFWMAFRG